MLIFCQNKIYNIFINILDLKNLIKHFFINFKKFIIMTLNLKDFPYFDLQTYLRFIMFYKYFLHLRK